MMGNFVIGHLHKSYCDGDTKSFFRDIYFLLAGTKEMYAYIRLKATMFIKSKGAHIHNLKAYLKQLSMQRNCVQMMPH